MALNAEGYQVYAVINQVPQYRLRELSEAGRGFTSKLDVAEVRAVFADLDSHEDAAERIASAPLPPSIVVRSSSQHKLHAYWLTRDLAPAEFSSYQRAIATLLGSDPAVVDLPRIMRVPGFLHRKDGRDAVRSELLLADPERVYSAEQLREAFGVEPEAEDLGRTLQQSIAPDLAPSAVELVVEALKHPDPAKLANRHDCMKAVLNLGARAGRLQDMVRYLQSDEIRLAWVKDGNVRSHSAWLSEIDRWVVAETAQGRYGIKTLTDNGFPIPDLPRREQAAKRSRTRIWTVAELLAQPAPHWLVRDLLMEDSVAMLYGEPAAGKSFLALDLALSVATGSERWAGRRIRAGGVVYLLGEGEQSAGKRISAWIRHNGLDPEVVAQAPLRVVTSAGVLSDKHRDAALAQIRQAAQQMLSAQQTLRLVVIDTVSRHMVGNENSAEDVKPFLAAADQVRQEFGVTVLLIHHTGKDESKGARGSSVLLGDTDTMLKVRGGEDSVTIYPEKQKDGPGQTRGLRFRKSVIDLGRDEEGERESSLALTYEQEVALEGIGVPKLNAKQLRVVMALHELSMAAGGNEVGVSDAELWQRVRELGIYPAKSSYNSCMERLSTGGKKAEGLNVVSCEDGK